MAVAVDARSPDLTWLRQQDRVCMTFTTGEFTTDWSWKGFESAGNSIARLLLKRINLTELGTSVLLIFEGQQGEHRLLSPFHQNTNRMIRLFKKQDPTNVNLPGNLYDQVRIAYSIPRIISMITVREGDKMNMFPTDLHGPVDKNYYISSLRIGGKANEQVERAGSVVLSNITALARKEAYALGKNHTAEVRPYNHFELAPFRSRVDQAPLPKSVLRYRELERIRHFDCGIHRIHFYKILAEEIIQPGNTLAHIHNYYGQWRLNHRMPTEFLLR
jgi:flavin reductase (DIM6/NTAB) family NADH-FMN oxidoreductase RutF